MKLQIGDIFVEVNTDNSSNIGLLVSIKEEHTYQYYIDWSSGTRGHYKKSEISHWIDKKYLIYFPVVK